MTKRRLAVVTGLALILMGLIAGYSIGYLFPMFKDVEELARFANDTDSFIVQWTYMLLGIGIILFLDLLVSYTLAKFFENESKGLSWGMGILRVVYTIVFAFAALQMTSDLDLDNPSMELVLSNIEMFEFIWNGGLILFGFHIIVLGYLMKLHHKIHFLLWGATLFAGVCYIITSSLKVGGSGEYLQMVLEAVLGLPMAIGELGLAVWLIVKGGK